MIAMSNVKLNQMKNLIFIEQLILYHIYRIIRGQLPQALVLMIHSQMKSMENRSENHLTFSIEKQVVLKHRFFQIRMIIWSTTEKMRCRQTKRMMSSKISIKNGQQRRL